MTSAAPQNKKNPTKPRVLFYVQHLLGVGHVFRAKRLIAGMNAQGIGVDVVFGGPTLPDMQLGCDSLHFLPVIKAGAIDYSFNVDGRGNRLSDGYMAKRKERLLQIAKGLRPDLVLVEAFPFGRRFLRDELQALFALMKERKNPPMVVCSVRDILHENRKPKRFEESVETLNTWFDQLIVHSDPALVRLEATFPLVEQIMPPIHYSGFVVDENRKDQELENFDVVVSVGGGAFGAEMLEITQAAHDHSSLKDFRWCLATGPNLPSETVEHLRSHAPENMEIRSFLNDLKAHMAKAKMSISQSGYNTTMDVLAAWQQGGGGHVFVPFDVDGQSEQLRRAKLMQEAGMAICLPQSEATPEKLADAMERAMALPKMPLRVNFNGVENSAALIVGWIDEHRRCEK